MLWAEVPSDARLDSDVRFSREDATLPPTVHDDRRDNILLHRIGRHNSILGLRYI